MRSTGVFDGPSKESKAQPQAGLAAHYSTAGMTERDEPPSMTDRQDDGRGELIAPLRQVTTFAEGPSEPH